MKKHIVLIATLLISSACYSQTINTDSIPSAAYNVAYWQAANIKNSLGLSDSLQMVFNQINIGVFRQKEKAWTAINDSDALSKAFQAIEYSRDSLYKSVLPEEKYLLYQQMKLRILTAPNN